MKIVLCDDEQAASSLLKEYLQEFLFNKCIKSELICYENAENLLWDIEEKGFQGDCYLLDIQMSNMNGMDLAKQIRNRDENVPIAFVTGIKDYVFEGYEVNALGYILKPYEKDQIERLMTRVIQKINDDESQLMIQDGKNRLKIAKKDCLYFEANGHDVILHLKKENKKLRTAFKDLNGLEKEGFVKVHRSLLVNGREIDKVTRTSCILSNQEELPIARGSYDKVMEVFLLCNK